MNQTVITGNLTADIETRELKLKAGNHGGGDQHLSKFTIASNEGERVVFMPVEAWNMAHLAEYLSKGSKALISGSLKQENWETDAGDKRSRIVLTAYRVEFLDPAPDSTVREAPRDDRRQSGQSAQSAGNSRGRSKNGREGRRAPARNHRAA